MSTDRVVRLQEEKASLLFVLPRGLQEVPVSLPVDRESLHAWPPPPAPYLV